MSPKTRRAWAWGLVAFFVVMCGMIELSVWYAYKYNVPHYQHLNDKAK